MKFGQELIKKRYEPWAGFYLDYEALKKLLEEHKQVTKDAARRTSLQIKFVALLEEQVNTVVSFFLKQQGLLSAQLEEELDPRLAKLLELPVSEQQSQLPALFVDFSQAGITLLRLVHFVDLNVTGLRKICKKYDKLTGGHLSQACFRLQNVWTTSAQQTYHVNGQEPTTTPLVLRPLLEDGGIQALYVRVRASLIKMDELQEDLEYHNQSSVPRPLDRRHTYSWDSHSENGRHDELSHSERLALNIPANLMQDSEVPPPPHVIVLLKIKAARRKLQKSSDFVRMLAAAAVVLPEGDDDHSEATMEAGPAALRRRRISRFLNFTSTFLHMMDYYIVAPTAGLYAQALGEQAAMAGIIIGLNSVSALGSTILYSWWSTFSYRRPLMFATLCQLIGALVYASGLPMRSLTLLLVGRFIGGFGSARSINRRYIADMYAVQDRTAASADLVTAGAIGTAAGPAVAALLFWLAPNDLDSGNRFWQVENAPGWVMATLWAILLVFLYVFFEEPPRRTAPEKEPNNGVHATGSELQPLLLDDKDGKSVETALTDDNSNMESTPLWKIVPVCTTFFVYFALKFNIESLWSSTSILTHYQFGWKGSTSGIYLAILGLMVMPANWVVAYGSQFLMDRDLMMITMIIMLWGCLAILQFSETYSIVHYIVGTSLIFVAANALEGPNMSLLSKTIPPQYSRGLWNVGLLATESGTLGRAVGGVILTISGSQGLGHIFNIVFGIMAGLSLTTIILCISVYKDLVEDDD